MQVLNMTHAGMQNPQNAGSDVHMGAETVQRPSQRKPKGTVTHPDAARWPSHSRGRGRTERAVVGGARSQGDALPATPCGRPMFARLRAVSVEPISA